ncbi:MAG: phosphate acyltransferase PlsX [Gammaproteobacteria bacterium]
MPAPVKIALDVMGGDLGPASALDGARLALEKNPNLHILLVGDRLPIDAFRADASDELRSRTSVVYTASVIAMSDSPKEALRSGADSSMRRAIECVRDGEAEACVSNGNTGALVAISKFVLKTIEGLRRPALLTPIPAENGVTIMLDVGANTPCTASMLSEFAVMGSIVSNTDYGIETPKVGLLNIGVEAGKGHEVLHEADEILGASSLNYIGFCEANQLFSSDVDVAVSDGFAGNIALKTMEGFSRFLAGRVASSGARFDVLDPRAHNGASLVGLRSVVIKSHGGADAVALSYAINTAMVEARADIPKKIATGIDRLQKS